MSQEIRNRIAKNLQELRMSKKIKREELSLLLGFDNSYISKLEKPGVSAIYESSPILYNLFFYN